MNMTFKAEWYEAANAIESAEEKAYFYQIVMGYYFEGTEPEESKNIPYVIFKLIKNDIDKEKHAKEMRQARKEKKSAEKPQAKAKENTKREKMQKPTQEQIEEYTKERKLDVNPQKFFDYYESNGWKVGRNPMKDWRAAVNNWAHHDYGGGGKKAGAMYQQEEDISEKYNFDLPVESEQTTPEDIQF